jgi:hypothetical protein
VKKITYNKGGRALEVWTCRDSYILFVIDFISFKTAEGEMMDIPFADVISIH